MRMFVTAVVYGIVNIADVLKAVQGHFAFKKMLKHQRRNTM